MGDQLQDALSAALAPLGLDLYDVELRGTSVVVAVDRAGGVDLDTLGRASRAVSDVLDTLDPIAGRYVLEVTSPGLERRLRTPAHFAQAVGETVTLRATAADAPTRRLTGRLRGAGADGIDIERTDAAPGEPVAVHVAYGDIERARTVFTWGPAAAADGRAASRTRRHPKTERVTTR